MISFLRKSIQLYQKRRSSTAKGVGQVRLSKLASERTSLTSLLSLNPPPLYLTAGTHRGEYGSVVPTLRGTEFYDLTPYYKGDHPKNIDWKKYFKTGELVRRRYATSQGSLLVLYLDATGSMRFSLKNGHSKLSWAKAMVLLLTQSALKGGHTVVWKIESQGHITTFPPLTSFQQALIFFKDLHTLEAQGPPAHTESALTSTPSSLSPDERSQVNPHLGFLFKKKLCCPHFHKVVGTSKKSARRSGDKVIENIRKSKFQSISSIESINDRYFFVWYR